MNIKPLAVAALAITVVSLVAEIIALSTDYWIEEDYVCIMN